MFSSADALNSVVNSFSGGTFFLNGADRSVSTVPGCNKMKLTWCFFLPNSMAQFFVSWFSAVLDALYEYHPPSPLSPMELTLADKFATIAGGPEPSATDLAVASISSGENALATSVGPIAFTLNDRIIAASSKRAMLVSGVISPLTCSTAAVCTTTSTRPCAAPIVSAADAMEAESSTSSLTTVSLLGYAALSAWSAVALSGSLHVATTCPPAAAGRPGSDASSFSKSCRTMASPMPRLAPCTRDTCGDTGSSVRTAAVANDRVIAARSTRPRESRARVGTSDRRQCSERADTFRPRWPNSETVRDDARPLGWDAAARERSASMAPRRVMVIDW
mmetsp:Transcript_11626/g.50112  ORF Transcript_11626/g.50112 Transcript_11626/m.50112 type:complete len:334 (+) Transcript_11626:128-1129(+)